MSREPLIEFEFLTMRLMIQDHWTMFVICMTTIVVMYLMVKLTQALTAFVRVTRS